MRLEPHAIVLAEGHGKVPDTGRSHRGDWMRCITGFGRGGARSAPLRARRQNPRAVSHVRGSGLRCTAFSSMERPSMSLSRQSQTQPNRIEKQIVAVASPRFEPTGNPSSESFIGELLDALQQRPQLAPPGDGLRGIAAVLQCVLIALWRAGRFAPVQPAAAVRHRRRAARARASRPGSASGCQVHG